MHRVFSLTHTLSHALTHTHSLSHTHTLTHTHTHSLKGKDRVATHNGGLKCIVVDPRLAKGLELSV
jgi:hypothetical protein